MLAFLGRYGHQQVGGLFDLTLSDLQLLQSEVGGLMEDEAEATKKGLKG